MRRYEDQKLPFVILLVTSESIDMNAPFIISRFKDPLTHSVFSEKRRPNFNLLKKTNPNGWV